MTILWEFMSGTQGKWHFNLLELGVQYPKFRQTHMNIRLWFCTVLFRYLTRLYTKAENSSIPPKHRSFSRFGHWVPCHGCQCPRAEFPAQWAHDGPCAVSAVDWKLPMALTLDDIAIIPREFGRGSVSDELISVFCHPKLWCFLSTLYILLYGVFCHPKPPDYLKMSLQNTTITLLVLIFIPTSSCCRRVKCNQVPTSINMGEVLGSSIHPFPEVYKMAGLFASHTSWGVPSFIKISPKLGSWKVAISTNPALPISRIVRLIHCRFNMC